MKPAFGQDTHDHDVKIGKMIGAVNIGLPFYQRLFIFKQIEDTYKRTDQKAV
jgi:hypothetical protein